MLFALPPQQLSLVGMYGSCAAHPQNFRERVLLLFFMWQAPMVACPVGATAAAADPGAWQGQELREVHRGRRGWGAAWVHQEHRGKHIPGSSSSSSTGKHRDEALPPPAE